MDLHQVQVIYQAEEDRLLYRASFRDGQGGLQEVRAWLTRRMIKGLWEGIVQALETQVSLDQPRAAHAKAEIVGMEHQAAVAENRDAGSFDQPYRAEAPAYPLGETPLLVSTVNFAQDPNKPIRINFAPAQGYGFEIALPPSALHGFCSLLQQAVAKAEWDLKLHMPGTAGQAAAPRLLN